MFRSHILGVDAGAANTGECEIEHLAVFRLNAIPEDQLRLGVGGIKFSQRALPVIVEVGGPWVCAGVGLKFGEGEIEAGHDGADWRGVLML